ncbi:MAG: 16S rRNA (adenine(1518)-N(6)/adenine(1519)-N(6))-dimethyltransferase RsmA [Gammaproteobacteria bacterium]|nr:MAG: 16S rRNA (adenine(1518)-N(6)/adenine(1519)-N(6))-dimethyltransferase RsmA [Gammaproteobacteria bacterium]
MAIDPGGHRARKRFGQNFLHDQRVIDRIARSIRVKPDDWLVEIGPGQGALTEALLAGKPKKLQAIELDRDLVPGLKVQFFSEPAFDVLEADALKTDFRTLLPEADTLRVVGNLPYNISTPLIFHILEAADRIHDMHFMLQREVVERLVARPGTSDYGRLSVMAQYRCAITHVFDVGPGAFRPAPKVWSAIVRLVPHEQLPFLCKDEKLLAQVVRQAFSQRRKTLRNGLKTLLSAEDWEVLPVDPSRRPETLSVEEFVQVTNFIAEKEA